MRITSLIFPLVLLASLVAQEPPAPAPAVQAPLPPLPTATATANQAVILNGLGETVLSPRIRNVTQLHNSMPHKLVGIGLVTGLSNTGSSDRGTRQAILNLVRKLGLNLTIADVVGGTTALVTVTCELPPFAKEGQNLDIKCEVMADASSLRGGELLRTELKGVDNQTYVVASGAVTVCTFDVTCCRTLPPPVVATTMTPARIN